MSDEQKPVESGSKPVDDANELAELLDSSLKDFGKSRNTDDELDDLMMLQDQEAAQKAASDFQTMLAQMVKVQEEAFKAAGENEGKLPDGSDLPDLENDLEAKAMLEAMKQLMECSGQVANAQSPEDFMKGLDALRGPESPMEPFMAMMMQTLASKEVMYPPLKDILDAYPKYLEENATTLDAETKERYEKQYEVIQKICVEFEKQPDVPAVAAAPEGSEPSAPVVAGEEPVPDMTAFETLGKLLVELQTLGYPPRELVGSLPPGWSTDDQGMPKVEDVSAAAEACSIM